MLSSFFPFNLDVNELYQWKEQEWLYTGWELERQKLPPPPLEIFGRGKIVKYAEFLYFFLVSVGENDISNG